MKLSKLPTISLFKLSIFSGSIDECVMICREKLAQKKLFTIATPNPEQVVMSNEQPSFVKTLQSFDLRIPDGQGLIWAGRLQGKKLTQRIGGRELVARLLPIIKDQKLTALVIGGEGYGKVNREQITVDSPHAAVSFLNIRVRKTSLFWAEHFDKTSPKHTEQVLDWIKANHPQIVFVALGAPTQEEWIIDHAQELEKSGVKITMVVGGAFDTLTGNLTESPQIVQKMGFEWLWRLIQQPWRWRRQLKLINFIWLAFFSHS